MKANKFFCSSFLSANMSVKQTKEFRLFFSSKRRRANKHLEDCEYFKILVRVYNLE